VLRFLVLFGREPAREAREKGFAGAGRDLFAGFGAGWLEAARRSGAELVLAAPPEDRAGWARALPEAAGVRWIPQAGRSLGERLEATARRAARLGGSVVLVGGDVEPASTSLEAAFEALEDGAHAVLAPAPDGGVSLISLGEADLDLLGSIRCRQRELFSRLCECLASRGRRLTIVGYLPDVDGRADLRPLARRGSPVWRSLARAALTASRRPRVPGRARPRAVPISSPTGLRAPPAA
jgi:glycosyltransferase A (GT-A) superfamily protein (DUF2064 family)